MKREIKNRERGSVLLIALLFLALIAGLSQTILSHAQTGIGKSAALRSVIEGDWACRAAALRVGARAIPLPDMLIRQYDLDESEDNWRFSVSVTDSIGLVDLNQADMPALQALALAAGADGQQASDLAAWIASSRTEDDAGRPDRLGRPFLSIAELAAAPVLADQPMLRERMKRFATIHSGLASPIADAAPADLKNTLPRQAEQQASAPSQGRVYHVEATGWHGDQGRCTGLYVMEINPSGRFPIVAQIVAVAPLPEREEGGS